MANNPKFCDDLLLLIFSRLPPKSLLRLRCVSRSWCSLIDDYLRSRGLPLTMLGLLHTQERYGLLILGANDGQVDETLSFLPPCTLYLEACSNGLVLFQFHSPPSGDGYYVCNPATKSWVSVPRLKDIDDDEADIMFLAYDPCTSPYFKVLWIWDDYSKFQFYSSEKGCWGECRTLERSADERQYSCFIERCYACHRGAIYLLTGYLMLIFDLSEETYRWVLVPEDVSYPFLHFLGKLKGCICCASMIYVGDDDFELRIWMLDACSDNHQWRLKHCSRLNDLIKFANCETFSYAKILAFHENLDVVYFEINRTVYSYDLESNELMMILSEGSTTFRGYFYPYSPCWFDEWRTEYLKVATEYGTSIQVNHDT